MVRVLAPMFLVPAFAEESLMQSQDVAQSAGASRTQKMRQSSQAMEDQYVALLTNIVKSGSWTDPATGNPWVPKASILNPVVEVIEEMEGQLQEQEQTNSGIMNTHTESVKTINTNMASSLTSTRSNQGGAMTAARTEHTTCRGAENSLITTMETDCKAFADVEKCDGHEQNWYAAIKEGGGKGTGAAGSLQDAVDKAVVCKADIGATTEKANACDAAQDDHKQKMCTYATAVTTICSNHETDWTNGINGWIAAYNSITKLEEEQKIIYRMLGRIRCYMTLLFRGSEGKSMPEQSDIENCRQTAIDPKILDVTYYSTEAQIRQEKPACLTSSLLLGELVDKVPGDGQWYAKEYAGATYQQHGKLQADSDC